MFSFCILALMYFLPTILAAHRGHGITAILLLNVFFGWTIVGWCALLLWALLSRPGLRLYRYADYPSSNWNC